MSSAQETGLVLCGGGGRGAYQIGVWRALRELELCRDITAVSGTSVGALNAALFACGDYQLAEKIWTSIRRQDITDPVETAGRVLSHVVDFLGSENKTITIPDPEKLSRSGIFSRSGLISLIAENGVNRCVSGCGMPCFACCHNSDLGIPEYFDLSAYSPEEITVFLTASSAIPAVFPAEEINGYHYRDGGISDNIPVKPLYDIGIRRFIISYLGKDGADLSAFPDAEFIELFPSDEILLGKPEKKLLRTGTLDFDGENAALRIELGYRETMKRLSGISSQALDPSPRVRNIT